MTKYNRITGKVFGENATATGDDPEIGQFGSAKDGSYIGTTDVATIQSLPAWSKGWIEAVSPEDNFPPLPEMTGAMKVLSQQQCYLLQQGLAEWDSATIYYTNNFASKNGRIYISQTDENQGNDPSTDTTNWKEFTQDKLIRYPIEISDKSLMPSWYVVYSDGWCEQGGYFNPTANGIYTITFLKSFKDTNYTISASTNFGSNTNYTSTVSAVVGHIISNTQIHKKTTLGFSTGSYNYLEYNIGKYWEAKGYIN